MRLLLLVSLAAFVAAPVVAQETLVESVEVRVINVDVVVRDRTGKPVYGLTKTDFEIAEDNHRQTITNLYEVRPEVRSALSSEPGTERSSASPEAPMPQEWRQRRVAFFLDTWSLHPFRRNQILAALRKFEEGLRPDDQVMVVTFDQGLHVIQGFTADRSRIEKALAAVERQASGMTSSQQEVDLIKQRLATELGMIAEAGRSRSPSQSLSAEQVVASATSAIETYAEQVSHRSQRMLDSLAKATTAMAGLDGKKIMIFAGEHLPERPGAELFVWLASKLASLPRTAGNMSMAQSAAVSSLGGSAAPHQRFSIEAAAKTASANGVTLYMLDAGDADRDGLSSEHSDAVASDETFTAFTNTRMAFETVSKITGGLTFANVTNWQVATDVITEDLNSYYSLGYRPTDETRVGGRRIEVRAKNHDYYVRARHTYIQKSSDEEMSDRVMANIFNDGVTGSWRIALKPGVPQRSGTNFKVPIEVSIDPTITLLPREKELVGGFTLYIAVANRGGGMSDVSRSVQAVKIPAEAEVGLRSRPMSFTAIIAMSPGENTLSIGIIDQISAVTGFARAVVQAR